MNTAQQNLKQALKKTARQIRNEPLEILKSAAKQVTGDENIKLPWEESETNEKPKENNQSDGNGNGPTNEEKEYKKKVAEQDGRRLEALESELRDIRRQKKFNELLARIQSGEEVPIEEFQELSSEQRDVLKAQLEATQKRKQRESQQQSSGIPMPTSKQGRQMGAGARKRSAQKETTRVEKPVPPSG
jgi:hypothetical protein